MAKKYRVGIDVGGTFTDATVIDGDTFEVVAKKKIPTTHTEGVAAGIIRIISAVLEEANISPEEVTFIAHGTTQATNALLEGDVSHVGILGMGTGFDARNARNETDVPAIELCPGKFLPSSHRFLDSGALKEEQVQSQIREMAQEGAEVILASEAFSVDNPENEEKVRDIAANMGFYASVGHEISQLYGLRMRTRTALINASLLPRMMQTADMTEQAVLDANIQSKLMIMRCDGGVMSIDEVRKRPILTMLSGLAAGVAGALMSERVSDGIFFEVGGTSIDISVIKNGQVMIKYAQVGGHKTYLRSVDVRTIGIAGGTMIRVKDGKIADVGPRSAHIAGKAYECFPKETDPVFTSVRYCAGIPGDPEEYAVVRTSADEEYAYTLTGAANVLGFVPDNDYAKGDVAAARAAWQVLADQLDGLTTAEEAAQAAMDIALDKVMGVVNALIAEYGIERSFIRLVGGGGGAGAIVPALGARENMTWSIAKDAAYISTIGVALAMVKEQIERTIINPTDEDIARVRAEAIEMAVRAGACEETVEVTIEIDPQRGLVRAVASGATELRAKEMGAAEATEEELLQIAAEVLNLDQSVVFKKMAAGRWNLIEGTEEQKKLFGLLKSRVNAICMIDREGVVRFKHKKAKYCKFQKNKLDATFQAFLDDNTYYSDANATLPHIFVFYREKMLDLSGIQESGQLMSILRMELRLLEDEEPIIAVAYHNQ